MTFERFALKQPCVSYHVLSSSTCSFWIKFMWGSTYIIYENIEIVNVWANIPKDLPRVLEEGPFTSSQTAKTSPTYGWQ